MPVRSTWPAVPVPTPAKWLQIWPYGTTGNSDLRAFIERSPDNAEIDIGFECTSPGACT
jgi:hypothetical protein